jgi:FtsH-binding integral membrane protein
VIPKTVFGRTPWWSFVLDLVLVLAFVLIGRRSHDESDALTGILTTAWPFVSGLVLGWLVLVGFRWPFVTVLSGAVVTVVTVLVGMLLRHSSDQGVAVSFVIVATVVLAVFLIGWRALAILLAKRRRAARA